MWQREDPQSEVGPGSGPDLPVSLVPTNIVPIRMILTRPPRQADPDRVTSRVGQTGERADRLEPAVTRPGARLLRRGSRACDAPGRECDAAQGRQRTGARRKSAHFGGGTIPAGIRAPKARNHRSERLELIGWGVNVSGPEIRPEAIFGECDSQHD